MDYHFHEPRAHDCYASDRPVQGGRLSDRARSLCEHASVQSVYD